MRYFNKKREKKRKKYLMIKTVHIAFCCVILFAKKKVNQSIKDKGNEGRISILTNSGTINSGTLKCITRRNPSKWQNVLCFHSQFNLTQVSKKWVVFSNIW
jgi:hypothetical protein